MLLSSTASLAARHRVAVLALVATLLAGCVVATSPVARLPRDGGSKAFAGREVADLVQKSRLMASLAVLAGKEPLAPGLTIPERGSVAGRALTRRFITSSLEGLGYTVERHVYRPNGENLMVKLTATTPSNEWILVGAHMDSVNNAGANDNGTGSAAVLETARVLREVANRPVNVLFAWFDEEEHGLVGSEHLARDLRKQGLNLTSVHTIDMMGWDKDLDRAVEIEQPDGGLWDYYKAANDRHHLGLTLVRTSSGDTDHEAFRAEGFTSVGLCEEWVGKDTTPHYHKKTDTYETIDFDYLTSSTRLLVSVASDLASRVPAPPATKLIPHDRFPGRSHQDGHSH